MPAPELRQSEPTDTVHPGSFRSVLGHFCTGLTVITAMDGGEPVGMTCQSFTSVSLDPPLVGFLPARSSTTFPRIRAAGRFTVHVLHEDQQDLCQGFAASGADKWAGVSWDLGAGGTPRLQRALAWIDCVLWDVHDAGDHHFVLGRVVDLVADSSGRPLLYFQGRYGRLHPSAAA